MNYISPSILSADFSCLRDEIKRIEDGGIKYLHIDVMDGHFVPNITFGPPVVSSIRSRSSMIFDVHLMISHPLFYAESFAKAGADYIVFHAECDDDIGETIKKIKSLGVKCGISIKPQTEPEVLQPYIKDLDIILVMTVEPGKGGQKMIPECLGKLPVFRKMAEECGVNPLLEVDGGITVENIKSAAESGAQIIVAGSSVFGQDDPLRAAWNLQNLSNT